MTLVIITSVLCICTVYHVCGTFDIMNTLYNICSCCIYIFRVQGLILFIYLLILSVLVLDAAWFSSLFFLPPSLVLKSIAVALGCKFAVVVF